MKRNILIIGDLLAIAILTFIGFASHGETNISFMPRMAATFFPLIISWFLVAPWLGLFDEQVVANRRFLRRPALAMVFVAPMATVLRAAMLDSAALPLFTLILGSTGAFGMTIWRGFYTFFTQKK